jgi:hypothetical protein
MRKRSRLSPKISSRPGSRLVLALCVAAAGVSSAVAADDFEAEPINYSKATPQNVVTRLQKQLDAGTRHFEFDERTGYLRSLLGALEIPQSSQMLVFSKTSFQRQRIAPRSPRALYFNDNVYVGYCANGDLMEISAADPKLGAVFYTLDQERVDKPRIVRQTDNCLLCHANSQTRNVPGFVIRSVFSDTAGFPILGSGTFQIDDSSPLAHRWGGWYVTGTHGHQKHMGNLIVTNKEQPPEEIDNSHGMNVTSLDGRFDRAKYLADSSDIVALLVMEHQTTAHNLLAAASLQTRLALAQEAVLNRALKQPAGYRWDSTNSRIRAVAEPLVNYLFFRDEAALTEPIRGTTRFADDFAARGPRDKRGRSLRDFDLTRRVFKYPLSYLIYSPAFDALPGEVKTYVSRRMGEILSGGPAGREFPGLSAADRMAIVEILKDTKPNLAASWKAVPVAAN